MLLRGGVDAAGRIALPIGKMVGRTGSVRRRMLLRGGVGAAGRIALPVGKMVGRTGLGPPKNAPAGGVGAAGRIALPILIEDRTLLYRSTHHESWRYRSQKASS
jgi:hypothetical protein